MSIAKNTIESNINSNSILIENTNGNETAYSLPGELLNVRVVGAREHNLKNVSVEIPRDKITVITGLSGSGKSSLAFDTLYAEGQRRYVECLSPYARQFLGMMQKPDVDLIEGLSPAISIEQKTLGHNPRSTVGTVTEIYDYLRLLFSKIGIRYCINCDIPVIQKNTDQITNEIETKYKNKKIQILAPLVVARKGHYRELFETLRKQGFTKVRIDGKIVELEYGMQVSRYQTHNIEVIVDRMFLGTEATQLLSEVDTTQRLRTAVENACKKGEGAMMLLAEDSTLGEDLWIESLYSTKYSCPKCDTSYENLAPNLFSFNSPFGACPECNGLGEIYYIDEDLLIPDKTLSINKGAILLRDKDSEKHFYNTLEFFAKSLGIDLDKPFVELTDREKSLILDGDTSVEFNYEINLKSGKSVSNKNFRYEGLLNYYTKLYASDINATQKKRIENVMSPKVCHSCKGSRLKTESIYVKILDINLEKIINSNISDVHNLFKDLAEKLTERDYKIGYLIIQEITNRLEFLINVGLHYLNLGRAAKTLSGGEAQRIRLASQIGSKLVGVTYVLDEPSIGLHQHDNYRLIKSLQDLRDLGNTLIVVEHDKAMIENADHFIDMGPGAGVKGGEVVLSCPPSFLLNQVDKIKNDLNTINTTNASTKKISTKNSKKEEKILNKSSHNNSLDIDLEKSVTAKYILGTKNIEYRNERRVGNGNSIKLYNATGNNLKNVDLELPLGKLICVTGMSGSGKSTLINDTLYPILSNHFNNSKLKVMPYDRIEGLEFIDKIIEIDQSPIGRTPRSNPSTYTGLFTHIRDFFALLPDSKLKGYGPGRFSFNVKDGRCEECQGAGIKKIEMNFLPEVYVNCDSCNGQRYNRETLTVHFKGMSISDVLNMTVDTAMEFFKDIPKIYEKVKAIHDVGLGYITLGQQSPTLSGGEAQRVKLATELSKRSTGKTLYLLDEPTTGLHFEDINLLQNLIDKLVDKGNTVVIIEHNLDVIKCADWVIDMGPEGGKYGGEIVAQGTPEEVVKNQFSLTGKYLKDELKN